MPGIFISILTCVSQLLLFRLPNKTIDREQFKTEAASLGPLTDREKRLTFWLAVVLWGTGSIIDLDAGRVTAAIAVILSLPVIGDVVDAKSLKHVSIDTPLYVAAVLAISSVSRASGMSDWLAQLLLSFGVPTNPWLFAPAAVLICMVLHFIMGSSLSTMGVIAPPLVSLGVALGFPSVFPALITFIALAGHWVLSYHHVKI